MFKRECWLCTYNIISFCYGIWEDMHNIKVINMIWTMCTRWIHQCYTSCWCLEVFGIIHLLAMVYSSPIEVGILCICPGYLAVFCMAITVLICHWPPAHTLTQVYISFTIPCTIMVKVGTKRKFTWIHTIYKLTYYLHESAVTSTMLCILSIWCFLSPPPTITS